MDVSHKIHHHNKILKPGRLQLGPIKFKLGEAASSNGHITTGKQALLALQT